jgi:cytosine/uracil/thiamine/allantoin permease
MADIAATTIESELRQRYHQPKGVEQFGIEAIPQARKTVRWYDLFAIILNFLISPSTILRGGLGVAAGLSFQASIIAECSGIVVACVFYVIMATVGVDYGIPGQVATRAVYGLRGSKIIPSFLRSIASCYWFAFQTVIGATAICAVLEKLTGNSYSLVLVSVLFGIVQAFVAILGYDSLKALSRVALPVKLLMFVYLFVLLANQADANFAPSAVLSYSGTKGWDWIVFVAWFNAAAAGWLTMITDSADFCRYSRTRTDMWIGTLLAAGLGTAISGSLGAYAAARDTREDSKSVRRRRRHQHRLGDAGGDLGIHRARQLDDQRPQPLYWRPIALEHVRAARPVLDDDDCQRRQRRAVGDPGCAQQLSPVCDVARQLLFADRRRPRVRLPFHKADPARRPGVILS